MSLEREREREREKERERESPDGKMRISLLYDFNHLRYQGSNESHQKKVCSKFGQETKKASKLLNNNINNSYVCQSKNVDSNPSQPQRRLTLQHYLLSSFL